MIRIRCITSFALPIARDRIAQVEQIFAQNFPKLADYADKIPDLLTDPIKQIGTYMVPIRVYKDVEPEITVEIVPES